MWSFGSPPGRWLREWWSLFSRSRWRVLVQQPRRLRAAGLDRGRELERQAHRRFLSRLDHELKNPVTAIRAAAAGLTSRTDADERTRLTAAIDGQAARLGTLVGELRKLAELESRPLDLEQVDIAVVIGEAVEDIHTHSPANGFGRRRIDIALPRAPWPLPTVRGDLDLIYLATHGWPTTRP